MTKFYSLLFALLMSTALLAQSPPQSFSYQTVIRDAGFNIMANQVVVLKLSILEDEPQGLMVYQEKHVETTSPIGLVNLFIGEGNTSSGSFDAIDWANHAYFLEVAIDFDNDDNFIIMGTSQLRSVPYALYALNAGNANQGPIGLTGPQGEQGIQGEQGLPGTNGQDGNNGVDGAQGETGAQGPIGLTGPQGEQGIQGEQGLPGTNGQDGNNGVDGAQGETGAQGPIGLTGPQGEQGIQGEQGLPGTNGQDGNDGVDGAQGATGPAGANGVDGIDGIDAVVDYDSLANLISMDSTFAASVSGGLGGGCDLIYPDGLNGEPITHNLTNSNDYLVPSGKKLYILNHFGNQYNADIRIDDMIISQAGNYESFHSLANPIIVASGQVVSCPNNNYVSVFNGFLVNDDSNILAITHNLFNSNDYIVPSGKKLYILNHFGNQYNADIRIDDMIISQAGNYENFHSLANPIIVASGQVVSCPNNIYVSVFNGYLVDENYFEGCGGGGGSSSSASNATIDSLSQVVSNLDSTVNALTSQINFGCTDSSASNYNSSSNIDDGSCTYPTPQLAIGDTYQGGIIFYILQPGDIGYVSGQFQGLIAADTDQSSGAYWGCFGANIPGADGIAIGTGAQNTIDIEAGCTTPGIAADICTNLTLGGYSDWFLPSKDELNQIYVNLHQQGLGGFANVPYWSSTESAQNYALVQYFNSGSQSNYGKNYDLNCRVRAVRAF